MNSALAADITIARRPNATITSTREKPLSSVFDRRRHRHARMELLSPVMDIGKCACVLEEEGPLVTSGAAGVLGQYSALVTVVIEVARAGRIRHFDAVGAGGN